MLIDANVSVMMTQPTSLVIGSQPNHCAIAAA
jgi:hypothetical protein